MKKLYVFGDSFTDDKIISNNKSYIQWKGYTPKTFHQIISENLDLEVINFSKSYGMDNYTIFQQICNNINQIDDGIVIINWSEPVRFRMVDTSLQKWRTIIPNSVMRLNKGLPYVNGVIDSTIDDMFLNRQHSLWLDEINSWIHIINKALINTIVVHWSWYNNTAYQTITEETNNQIIDFHYSEFGNIKLAEWLLVQIQNEGYRYSPFLQKSIL